MNILKEITDPRITIEDSRNNRAFILDDVGIYSYIKYPEDEINTSHKKKKYIPSKRCIKFKGQTILAIDINRYN